MRNRKSNTGESPRESQGDGESWPQDDRYPPGAEIHQSRPEHFRDTKRDF